MCYNTQNDMAGDKSRDIHPCFHNGPLWICRKEKKYIYIYICIYIYIFVIKTKRYFRGDLICF